MLLNLWKDVLRHRPHSSINSCLRYRLKKSYKPDVKQDGRNQTDTTPLTVRGRSRSPPAIQPSYPLGAERARFHYPSCVRLTVLRQLFVCEIYSPFNFKRETRWKQDARGGMPEKIRGAYAPVPFWITGLLMVFTETIFRHSQRPPSFSCPCMGFLRALRRPFSDVRESCKLCGLYNDRFQAHTKTICRKEKKLLPGQSLKTDRVTAP